MLIRVIIEIVFFLVLGQGAYIMLSSGKKRTTPKAKKGKAVKKADAAHTNATIGRKLLGSFIVLADIAAMLCICYVCRHSVFTIPLPEGELHWSTSRPESDVQLCVPAAYSDQEGRIIGQYMSEGKTYNTASRNTGKTSIKNNIFYADYRWLSDEGFQQHTLVMDSKPKTFTDKRYKVRRALCKNAKGAFLVQSHLPMSLNSFARKLAQFSTNAVNLDMGHLGYGFFRWHGIALPLSVWTYANKDEQTNWLYVE